MNNGRPNRLEDETRAFDVAIVGGGIAGAGLAAALGARKRVVLVEREPQAGTHATGRSAAVFVPNYGDGPIRRLTDLGAEDFHRPDPDIWEHPLLKPRGLLRLATAEGAAAYDKQMTGARAAEDISLAEARELFPILKSERFVRASYEPAVCDVDVDALLQGYLRKARRSGVEILLNTDVTSIARLDGRWQIDTAGGPITAPVVVNAAGAWADEVARRAGVRPVGLRPLRRTVAVVDLPDDIEGSERWPFVVPFPLDWYAKPDSGRLLVSPGDEDLTEPHDVFSDDMVTAEGLHRFEQDVTFTVERVPSTWAGLRTFSPDTYPLVGFDSSACGFFWLAGQGGFGVQTAPALSRLAAGLLSGEEMSSTYGRDLIDLLSPARFAQTAMASQRPL